MAARVSQALVGTFVPTYLVYRKNSIVLVTLIQIARRKISAHILTECSFVGNIFLISLRETIGNVPKVVPLLLRLFRLQLILKMPVMPLAFPQLG